MLGAPAIWHCATPLAVAGASVAKTAGGRGRFHCPVGWVRTRSPAPSRLPAVAGDAWQVVWADGSAVADQASDGFARVSWAVSRGADGPVMSGLVLGAQTVLRAELFAVVVAAGAARGPLRIVTDSQYVARNIAKLRACPTPTLGTCFGMLPG